MSHDNQSGKFSRRTFLMGALASATMPAIFSTRYARANAGPNDTILLGFIGVGRQGRHDMKECIHQGMDANVRVVAVCDIDSKRVTLAKELAEKIYKEAGDKVTGYPGCTGYSDFRELIKREDLDGVVIVTPDHWHAIPAHAALKAGKDVYLEKPMTYTIPEGQALVKAVRDNKRILQVGSQQRSSIYFRKACELVRNGHVGPLHTIRVALPADHGTGNAEEVPVPTNLNYNMWMGPTEKVPYAVDRAHPQDGFGRPGWLQNERYCKGMITGWGAHMNDIAQWGNGTDDSGLVEIEATAEFPKRGLFDVHTKFKAEGKFSNGVKLFQETGEAGVRFEGDDGWVFVSREKLQASDPALLKIKTAPDGVLLYESSNHMKNFFDCMRSRKDPVAPVEVGHRSNSICLITHIAMKAGRKLTWDPKTQKFTNDEQANAMLDYPHREPWATL